MQGGICGFLNNPPGLFQSHQPACEKGMRLPDWDFHPSRCLCAPDVCSASSVLFSVVTNVTGAFGEPWGVLSGKHYGLFNHVFIPD